MVQAPPDCLGKKPFTSYAMATQVGRDARRRRAGTRVAYRCQCCHLWHVGSIMKKEGEHRSHQKIRHPQRWHQDALY